MSGLDPAKIMAAVAAAVAARQAKTTCPKGHSRTLENTGTAKTGRKFCRPCQRAASLAYYHKTKAGAV